MKFLTFFIKTFKENVRDWKIVSMIVAFGPMFVYLFYGTFQGNSAESYTVLVRNEDHAGTVALELIDEWKKVKTTAGTPALLVREIDDMASAKKMLADRSGDILVTIPGGFSASVNQFVQTRQGTLAKMVNFGDASNARYMMAGSLCDYTTFTFIGTITGIQIPLDIEFRSIAGPQVSSGTFDLMIPALIIFALIMVFFSAGATLVREIEKGTITRLMMSRLTPFEFLGSVTINQVLIGLVCVVLTLLAAWSVGYVIRGSLTLLVIISIIACGSIVAISFMCVCFIRSMLGLMTVGCFPWAILTFFSDCFFPLPKKILFTIAGNPFFLNDILPTAIATRAFNKILNFNAAFTDVSYELAAITVLTVLYFYGGALLFKRVHFTRIS